MEACVYCSRGLGPGVHRFHPECHAERNSRIDVASCIMCDGAVAHRGLICEACDSADDPQYVGYPPEAD